jgi:hypothetical protein
VAKPLRPREIVATLAAHRVRYVMIGGLAAVLHGSPTVTADADICPDRSPSNLQRLVAALEEMHARIRTADEPDGLELPFDAAFLSRMKMVDLTTDFGDFDLSFEPAGFTGYDDLVERAVDVPIGGSAAKVAALSDVIHSKEVANRDKDRATLPILYALQDEIAKGERNDRAR